MDGVNLPVSFINDVDPAFDVPFAKDAKGAVRPIYSPTDFPFDPAEYDVNGLHEFVAHFLCLAIKVHLRYLSRYLHIYTSCGHADKALQGLYTCCTDIQNCCCACALM